MNQQANPGSTQSERERLLQSERRRTIKALFQESFVKVWVGGDVSNEFHIFSCLIPLEEKERFLEHLAWDYRADDLRPRVECVWHGPDQQNVYYLKHGNMTGAEPVYHVRSYDNYWPAIVEIAEEFRLFFNLFQRGNAFLTCDIHGNEEEVARVSPDAVEIKLGFITRYLRAKQLHLAVQIDAYASSTMSLADLGLKTETQPEKDETRHFEFSLDSATEIEGHSRSRLIGKAVLPCPGAIQWQNPHDVNADQNNLFIVGIDSEGKPLEQNCRTGSDGQSQAFPLALVFFRCEVLLRYFNEPDKYTVQDGHLSCGALWDLRMDNDHFK